MADLSGEQWRAIEEKVNQAEKNKHRAAIIKSVTDTKHELTKEDKDKRESIGIAGRLKKLGVEVEETEVSAINQQLSTEKESLEREAEELLGDPGSPKDKIPRSPERELVGLRWTNLSDALKNERALSLERARLYGKQAEILVRIDQREHQEQLAYGDEVMLDVIRKQLINLDQARERLFQSTPEAFFGLRLKQMKEWAKNMQEDNFIETESIKQIEEEVIETIRIGKYPFLHGHMGSGKTEFATFISKKLTGQAALVFSSSKETDKAELMGHLALRKGEMPPVEKLMEMIDLEIKNFDLKNPDLSPEKKATSHAVISQYIIEREKTGTESIYDFGYVYKAMRDGIPLIIDAYNMIPHSVWGRMNELLKKKPGDVISIQEDGIEPFRVKKGFFFILTGNLNQGTEQYMDRVDLDPAGLRRIHPIKYDYLPQYYEKTGRDSISLEENAGPKNELFQLIVSKALKAYGIELPVGSMTKLWQLAMAARISQDLFAGRYPIQKFFPKVGGDSLHLPYFLKKINVDLGRIDNILEAFVKRPDRGVDFYVWRYGISEAVDEQDKAYLFQLFKLNFNFFEGWKSNEGDVLAGKAKELVVQPPENQDSNIKKEFFGIREMIELAFGKAPKRTVYPKIDKSDKKSQEDHLNMLQNLMTSCSTFEKDLISIYLNEFGESLDEFRIRLGQEA